LFLHKKCLIGKNTLCSLLSNKFKVLPPQYVQKSHLPPSDASRVSQRVKTETQKIDICLLLNTKRFPLKIDMNQND